MKNPMKDHPPNQDKMVLKRGGILVRGWSTGEDLLMRFPLHRYTIYIQGKHYKNGLDKGMPDLLARDNLLVRAVYWSGVVFWPGMIFW